MQIFSTRAALLNRISSFIGHTVGADFLEFLSVEVIVTCNRSTERDAGKQEPELNRKKTVLYFMISII